MRVAIQALSAVAGGAQSLHTNGFDEALALPTERSARIALRTQQILAAEGGVTDTADPLGGAYFIEALTDELEERARELLERIDELGGAVAAVEQGFVQSEIEEAAFRYNQEVESGERVIVGVNRFAESDDGRSSCCASTPPPSGASSSERHAFAPSGTRSRPRPRSPRCGVSPPGPRTCCRRCARRSGPASRSARSATRCATSSARTTRRALRKAKTRKVSGGPARRASAT